MELILLTLLKILYVIIRYYKTIQLFLLMIVIQIQYNSFVWKKYVFSLGVSISDKSSRNNIYSNNFINNSIHVIDKGPNNYFYSNKPLCSNFSRYLPFCSGKKINIKEHCFYNNVDLYPWNYQNGWFT